MEAGDIRRLKVLEAENSKLKRMSSAVLIKEFLRYLNTARESTSRVATNLL